MMRYQVLLTTIFLIFLINVLTAQVNEFNKGFTWIQFETSQGCLMQIQSFDRKITKDDLNKIVSILCTEDIDGRGQWLEFPISFNFFPDLAYDSLKKDLIQACKKDSIKFDSTIIKLEKYQLPAFFIISQKKLIKNFKARKEFDNIELSFLEKNNFEEFKINILKLCKDSVVFDLLDKLEKSTNNFNKMYFKLTEIYNELNCRVFPLEPIQNQQKELLKINKIRTIYEECVD